MTTKQFEDFLLARGRVRDALKSTLNSLNGDALKADLALIQSATQVELATIVQAPVATNLVVQVQSIVAVKDALIAFNNAVV